MSKNLPFVSVCTPTYNRRKFIPSLINNFTKQTYPQDAMELIIIDDGTDAVGDLFQPLANARYFHYQEKMPIGKKRNLLNEKARGDIILYMDDDDFQSSERVTNTVNALLNTPKALAAGSSKMFVFFSETKEIYQFGPYHANHCTAGTLAFKKELLKRTSFDNIATSAEEKRFLLDYQVPLVQLPAEKTILSISHQKNTFDRRDLVNQSNDDFIKKSQIKLKSFIRDRDERDFYRQL